MHLIYPRQLKHCAGRYEPILKTFLTLTLFIFSTIYSYAQNFDCAILNVSITSVACFGDHNGAITATASGGTSPYKFSLNGGGWKNSGNYTGLYAGDYQVRVKDATGCITTGQFTVFTPTEIAAEAVGTDVSCRGGQDGMFEFRVESIPPYVFRINSSAFQSDNFFRNLIAGTYTLTVKDGHGCSKTVTATIGQPATALTTTVTSTPVGCSGVNNGTLTVDAGGGTAPYTYSIDSVNFQQSNQFSGLAPGSYYLLIKDAHGCILEKRATVSPAPNEVCDLGYPDNSNLPRSAAIFNESEVLRAFNPNFSIICPGEAPSIKMWYNDEHAMALGVRRVTIKSSAGISSTDYPITPATTSGPATVDNPMVGSMIPSGDQSGNDVAVDGGRPMWPALFITDITSDPTSRAGDWQQGGTGIPPHRISGSWKGAVKIIDKTKNPPKVTVTPDANPPKNNWVLGPGGDPAPAGLENEGYGTEVVWFIDQLRLQQGHTYHLQFMVHDGDQNKTGGDVGQGCTTIYIPVNKTDETSSIAKINGDGLVGLGVFPNPFKNEIKVEVQTGSTEPITLRLFNLIGQEMALRENISPVYTLLLENDLEDGVYMLEIQQGKNKRVARMIKKQ
jgi:hypothetical protein